MMVPFSEDTRPSMDISSTKKFSSCRNLEVLKNNAPFDIRTVSYHEGQKVNLIPLIIKVDVIVLATIKKANSKRESTERHALQSV